MPWDDDIDWYPTAPTDWSGAPYDPERDPYEEIYQEGDGDGSNNSPTNPGSSNFDWAGIARAMGVSVEAAKQILGGGGGGGGLGDVLKLFGLSGGSGSLMPLLMLLAGGGAALNQTNKGNDAARQLQEGADKANALSTDLIGGARKNYEPYMASGVDSLSKLQGMVGNNNMGGKFAPVGANSALSEKFRGLMTLAQLSGK